MELWLLLVVLVVVGTVAGVVVSMVVVGRLVVAAVVGNAPLYEYKRHSSFPNSYGVDASNSARLTPCASAVATRAADGVYV